jgi:hypothetical protein
MLLIFDLELVINIELDSFLESYMSFYVELMLLIRNSTYSTLRFRHGHVCGPRGE